VIVGGDVGALLTLAASVQLIHAILTAQSATWNTADDRFHRLQRGHRPAGRRIAAQPLEVLDERTGWAALAQRRDLGVLEIRVDSICGTVEGSKTATFDGRFLPREVRSRAVGAPVPRPEARGRAAAHSELADNRRYLPLAETERQMSWRRREQRMGGLERLLSRRDGALRETTLWRLLYETAARAGEALARDNVDLRHFEAGPLRLPGDVRRAAAIAAARAL